MNWHRRLVALLSICILLLSSGCSTAETISNEQRSDYALDDKLLVSKTNSVTKSNDEKDSLKDMEKVLENKQLELYLGTNYDIAVYNKATGKVFWSNPIFHDATQQQQDALMDETKKLLFSQIGIEYYNAKQKKLTMTTYPDSFSKDKNQVSYEVVDGALVVKYGIGTSYENSGLIQTFSKETFEQYDKLLMEMVNSKKITMIDYRAFVNNYTKITYSEMKAEDKEAYSARYPKIKELESFYIIKPGLTNKITNQLLKMYTLLGINDDVKKAEEEKMGAAGSASKEAYFMIPLKYQLHGSDLVVSVDTKSIEAVDGYYLTKVELLKSFGATTKEDNGYLFLPDGSGTIVDNNTSTTMDKISIPFYGQDYGKSYSTYQDIAIDSSFPVFGLKSGDNAVFAIVENGSSIGGVSAQTTSNYLNYNIAYPYFDYTAMDTFNKEKVAYAFYGSKPDVDYAIRYHFLDGQDANYSGMARYYRKYLEQKGYIQKNQEQTNKLALDVQMIGSILKTVNYLGVPIDKEYGVTTFDNANTIMNELNSNNINKADVLYSGIANGGLNFKSVDKISVQKELGGLEGFKALESKLTAMGYGVYSDIDFTRIYEKGNAITEKEDVSKYLSKSTVYISESNPATGAKRYEGASYLINPLLYNDIVTSFMKEFEKTGSHKVYLSSIGAYLNGNYSTKAGVTRQTSLLLTKALLQKLKDNQYKMKLDYGNDYVLPFAESLTNVATTSSHQRIESYSIPFVGMVLKGYVPYTGKAVNQANNSEKAVLEAVESGAGLNYLLMFEDQLTLVGTQQMNLFSINYKLCIDDMMNTYNKLNLDLGYLANVAITEHKHVADDVNCVVYEDGSKVYVNYRNTAYTTPDGKVEAMSYLVVR